MFGKFNKDFENKEKISSVNEFKNLIVKNNLQSDFHIYVIGKYYLIDNYSNTYCEFESNKSLNDFIKEIHNMEFEKLEIKDYSNSENVSYNVCDKKCIHSFGNHKNCFECNYFKDCMIENEIDNFEKAQSKMLDNQLGRIENNEFY